jgi:hypothetical protein
MKLNFFVEVLPVLPVKSRHGGLRFWHSKLRKLHNNHCDDYGGRGPPSSRDPAVHTTKDQASLARRGSQ